VFTAEVVNLSMTVEHHQSLYEHNLWNTLHCHTVQILGNGCPATQKTICNDVLIYIIFLGIFRLLKRNKNTVHSEGM
jgi:hypothetical protein